MAAGQIAKAQTTDPGADESFYFVADFVKHPANLPVNSLPQNDPQPSRLERIDFLEARALAVEHHAAKQLRRERSIPGMVKRDLVFLFDFITRMSQPLGEIAVVGEKEQPFRLGIEPADIEESRQMGWQQVENRVPRIWIAPCRNKTRRLVQDDVESALTVDQFAVDFDVVALTGLDAEISADLAVDRNAAGCDQLIAMPARTEPGRGKETIQAHGGSDQ